MPIIVSEPVNERGKKDARRHRDKQREAIKKQLPEIISHESIITQKKGKVVRIPIRFLNLPHFKPKDEDDPSGLGQGPGGPGDVIGQRKLPANGSKPGSEPGEDYIEAEVPIEELIELMLEDLGLPKLEEKEIQNITVELGWKVAGLGKAGIWPRLDRRATAREGIKRFWYFLRHLESETGQNELTCFRALKQSGGVLTDALEIIKANKVTDQSESVEPFPTPTNEDLRYHQIKEDVKEQSRAVIIAMIDVSGSMTDTKKYFARSMLFWLVEFLRQLYQKVEVRFIAHHAVASIVSEDYIFTIGGGGGTLCYTAYEKALGLIESEYPPDSWNVYVWHFSDGEDFNTDKTIEEIGKLLSKGINMIGYGEIKPTDDGPRVLSGQSDLWGAFRDHFPFREEKIEDMDLMVGKGGLPLLCVKIEAREHILPALKAFLKKDRWAQ